VTDTGDFGKDKSGITHRTRVAVPLAVAVTVMGSALYAGWQVSRYTAVQEASASRQQEQMRDLKDSQARIESKVNTMDTRLIRLEFKVDSDEPRRRRP
jgi:uncharacterized protein YlxW (UPF0749 family)